MSAPRSAAYRLFPESKEDRAIALDIMRRKGYAQKRAIAEADDPDEQFDHLAESIGNAPVFQLRRMELFASAAFCSARAGVLHQTAEIRDKVGGAAFSRSSIKLAGYRYSRLPNNWL
ncbi:hypothetical protein U8Q05_30675 (plasmid) [Rhizobium ruizarguesonis]|nr:hypothetical protein U8Q05_30675 [Rhizobium ruizarguesonis]